MKSSAHQGFSVIELTVVVGIIALLGTLVVVRFSGSSEVSQVRDAERLLRTDIARAQSWAETGKTCCSDVVPEGYGIVINKSQDTYFTYAELDGNWQYDASGSDVIISSIDLSTTELLVQSQFGAASATASIVFEECTPLSVDDTCDVFFEAPAGAVYTNGTQTDNLAVTVSHVSSNITQEVTVTVVSGKID